MQDQNQNQMKKMKRFKNIFLVSTFFGIVGVYCLFKNIEILGWICVSIWAILATAVRVMIIVDRKKYKNK